MNKSIIVVPKGIKFLSEWKDLISVIPSGHVIINKTLTGCGFTEWIIQNDVPFIWCSPRKVLLENKEEQHPGDIYYARSNQPELEIDKDLMKKTLSKDIDKPEETYEFDFGQFEKGIIDAYNSFLVDGKCPKFCVTNDSFRKLKDVLIRHGIFDQFVVAADEMQVIFQDGRFKPDTSLEFVYSLQDCKNVIYVSATPMIEEALDEIDEFKNLPYLEFDWETAQPGRTIKAKITSNPCKSINTIAKKYISNLLEGKYEKKILFDDAGNPIKTVESKELVIYINSVKNIGDIIRQNNLTCENTAVICADTTSNRKKVRDAFRKSYQSQGLTAKEYNKLLPSVDNILSLPAKRGESNKPIILCTKTTYIGADFYSTNARTLILSDSDIECMAVDITLDLPQILGRQRDENNPWKYEADIWYKIGNGPKDITEEQFNKRISDKMHKTEALLSAYDTATNVSKAALTEEFEYLAKAKNYRDHYVGVNKHIASQPVPQLNKIVLVAEKRAFKIQRIDYKDRFSVMATIDSLKTVELSSFSGDMALFMYKFNQFTQFQDRMKLVCEVAREMDPESKEYYQFLKYLPNNYSAYLNTLGPDVILGYGCQRSKIEIEFQKVFSYTENSDPLLKEVLSRFKILNRYTKSEIKSTLGEIYQKLGILKTPKAVDIEEWFEIRDLQVTNSITKKRDHVFEIIKRK